jgi:hypothetical protein
MSTERDKIHDAELVASQHQHAHEPLAAHTHRKQQANKDAGFSLLQKYLADHDPTRGHLNIAAPGWIHDYVPPWER